MNFGNSTVNLKISIDGLELNSKPTFGSTKIVLTSTNLMDENSFSEPKKVSLTDPWFLYHTHIKTIVYISVIASIFYLLGRCN